MVQVREQGRTAKPVERSEGVLKDVALERRAVHVLKVSQRCDGEGEGHDALAEALVPLHAQLLGVLVPVSNCLDDRDQDLNTTEGAKDLQRRGVEVGEGPEEIHLHELRHDVETEVIPLRFGHGSERLEDVFHDGLKHEHEKEQNLGVVAGEVHHGHDVLGQRAKLVQPVEWVLDVREAAHVHGEQQPCCRQHACTQTTQGPIGSSDLTTPLLRPPVLCNAVDLVQSYTGIKQTEMSPHGAVS